MPEVWIPAPMQRITGAPDRVRVAGATVRQVINNLEQLHPGIKELLYDAELDDITPGLAVIVDGDVSQLGLMERVNADSEMHFLPAIGGGADAPEDSPAEPDTIPPPKKRPETLADFLQVANLIGVIDSSELGPEGGSMSVDTGNQSTELLGEKYQQDNPQAEPDESGDSPSNPPRSLYESLKDFIGVINSSELGPEGGSMSVDTGKQFTELLWEKYQIEQEEARKRYAKERGGADAQEDSPAEPDAIPPPKKRPETLADFLQVANLIGVIDSSELGPKGGSMSVDTGKQFTELLWEEYQRDQEEARQRYAKERARQQQSEQE